ncbi:MAG: mandelate racemase/muconate lactonizing enzyme family protein [Alphaproteobacteria bacterium]|jgi:galactonate dehydratase|nr:mandelate racemase/muconate lactonizing enzyme family protein [Alphaproteobacteria bacterium]
MKITEIKTFLMQAGSPPDRAWASDGKGHQTGSRNWLFVKVYTDEGVYGVGECSGWPRVIETAVKDLAGVLVGEDPTHIERLWQRMMVAQMAHGMTGIVGAGAMTGIDMALWDIKGKVLNTPVWNLLGGQVRDRIRIYAHASTAEVALELKACGIGAVKTGGVRDPLAKVAAIREAVGPDMDIMADLHGPPWMTPKDAIVLGRALEPYNMLFLEDPVAPENIEGLARVADAVAIPIAAGERVGTIWGWRAMIEREIVDVIQPDTGRAGGISQMKKLAGMAEAHHIMMAPHSGTLGPVAEFAALHLLAAIPNTLMLERIENDWPGRNEVISAPPVLENGHLIVPTTPGLGVDIDEAAVAQYPSVRNVSIAGGGYEPGTEQENVYVQTRLHRESAFGRRR